MTLRQAAGVCRWLCRRWRLWVGCLLWIVALLCLATAAEGFRKNEWILIGSIPITLLTIGFILPGRHMNGGR